MNRSKCGSVLTDRFVVIAMFCNKPVASFAKRVVVILFLWWATDVAGLHREIRSVFVRSLPLGNGVGFFLELL